MRVSRSIVALASLVLITVLSVGCKPKVGGKCTTGNSFCTGKDTALFCGDDNKLAATGCHGPNGCTQTGKHAACDQSLATAGDPCEDNENISCSVDKKAQLDCKDHKWVVGATCGGAKGCELKGDELFCDHTIAEKSDPCHRDGQIACTTDKSFILKCQGLTFQPVDSCRGPKGCTFEEQPAFDRIEFSCDDSFANEGDVCAQEELHSCSVDKKNILACKGGKFVQQKGCPGAKGCSVDPVAEKISCDTKGGIESFKGGTAKVSSAGNSAGSAKAKTTGGTGSAGVTASAKPTASVAASASAKPAASASASAAASASAKPGASAAPSAVASGKPAASASGKPVGIKIKK